MTDKVMKFLIASGGGSLDEILVRVPQRPDKVAESLAELAAKGYVRVSGPKGIEDFSALVAEIRLQNGYDAEGKLAQRQKVVEAIVKRHPDFMKTVVSPTPRGFNFG
jgi:hypothetical protein